MLDKLQTDENETGTNSNVENIESLLKNMMDVTKTVNIFEIKSQIAITVDKSVENLEAEQVSVSNLVKYLSKTYRIEFNL